MKSQELVYRMAEKIKERLDIGDDLVLVAEHVLTLIEESDWRPAPRALGQSEDGK
jgi:hypothetical protein